MIINKESKFVEQGYKNKLSSTLLIEQGNPYMVEDSCTVQQKIVKMGLEKISVPNPPPTYFSFFELFAKLPQKQRKAINVDSDVFLTVLEKVPSNVNSDSMEYLITCFENSCVPRKEMYRVMKTLLTLENRMDRCCAASYILDVIQPNTYNALKKAGVIDHLKNVFEDMVKNGKGEDARSFVAKVLRHPSLPKNFISKGAARQLSSKNLDLSTLAPHHTLCQKVKEAKKKKIPLKT